MNIVYNTTESEGVLVISIVHSQLVNTDYFVRRFTVIHRSCDLCALSCDSYFLSTSDSCTCSY